MKNNKYDIYEPSEGHFERFKERLSGEIQLKKKSRVVNLKWFLVAASFALLVSLWFNFKPDSKGYELADASPQMQETQRYFIQVIHREIKQINLQKDEHTDLIIKDTMKKVVFLENEYKNLTVELKNSGFDRRIINAMIYNFQQRIEILQNLIEQIENFKNNRNEDIRQDYV